MQAEAKISHNEGRNCEKYKESVKERQTRANFEKITRRLHQFLFVDWHLQTGHLNKHNFSIFA